MSYVKGKKVMLFIKEGTGSTATYKSIGFCTNHTFSTSASTVDVAHKDLPDTTSGAGHWDDQEIDTLSWTITSDAFYANTAEGFTYEDIFALYASSSVLDIKFGLTDASTTGVPTDGWTPSSTGRMLNGKCYISNIDFNAPVSENASFSITLTGKGAITLDA